MATETVLIDFVVNDEQVQESVDKLASLGKVEKTNADQFKAANTEINKQTKALKDLEAVNSQIGKSGTNLKKTIADVSTAVKGMSSTFQKEFKAGAVQALKEAGVSLEQFESALQNTGAASDSLKTQLRSMTQALAQMKVEGKDNTEEYRALALQAGQLKDAIADANQEVKNFGSDTSTFDGLISLTSGIAGGFAAVQGAAALFGDESEELQKTLLRVNAAMAILQGLQQIQVVLQKESAAAALANTIATKAQTAAQALFTFVVGTSTGALKAFRIALAATGVGLLVLGLIELVSVLSDTEESLEDVNAELERQKNLVDALNTGIRDTVEIQLAQAEASGALESKLIAIRGKGLQQQLQATIQVQRDQLKQRDALKVGTAAWIALNKAIEDNNEIIKGLNQDILLEGINFEKKLVDEKLKNIEAGFSAQLAGARKNSQSELEIKKALVVAQKNVALNAEGLTQNERLQIIKESDKKIRDLNREFQIILQNDRISGLEAQLSKEQNQARQRGERITQVEIDIQKKIIQEKADLELLAEGLNSGKILEIKAESLESQLKLQREFNKQARKEALEDIVSRNNAELSILELSDKKKIALTIENIIAQSEAEILENKGNSEKIKEINAKRDVDIRNARVEFIRQTTDYEVELLRATYGEQNRVLVKAISDQNELRGAGTRYEEKLLEKRLGTQRKSLSEQVELINQLTIFESGVIQKRIDSLNKERAERLISEKDYKLQYEKLVDEQAKIWEDAEKAKTDATKAEAEKRKQQTIAEIQEIVAVAQNVIGVLESLYSIQAQSEENRINEQKQRLADLQEAGAITEKEAITRQKRIEAEERRIKQIQAQRDKQIAVFRALLAIPEAVLRGLTQGGPVLAAIYGALASVQAALVIARPIPKFGKGKKNRYEGLAEVGETGAELIERSGRMYLAPKRTITYLGEKDKVFNPMETAAMLSIPQMATDRVEVLESKNNFSIDYEKIGEAVGKHVQTNVFVDGVQQQSIKKNLFTKWLNDRRSL